MNSQKEIIYCEKTVMCPWCNRPHFGGIMVVRIGGVYLCRECAVEFLEMPCYDPNFQKMEVSLTYDLEDDTSLRTNQKKIWTDLMADL